MRSDLGLGRLACTARLHLGFAQAPSQATGVEWPDMSASSMARLMGAVSSWPVVRIGGTLGQTAGGQRMRFGAALPYVRRGRLAGRICFRGG